MDMENVEDTEQRQSKKWKNRTRKQSKNYGVQVPPSSWIRGESEPNENSVNTFAKKRVTLFPNGDKRRGKAYLITSPEWDIFLKQTGSKLRMKNPARAYNESGKELTSVDEIRQDENVFIAKQGKEEFITITKPEDQISVRGEIADLKLNFVAVPLPFAKPEDPIGKITLFHRPKRTHLNVLRENGATHLLTLLCAKERADDIGNILKKNENDPKSQITWIWLPLPNGNPPQDDDAFLHILKGVRCAVEVLKEGGCIVIHCSAGIHRTGLVANALLRYVGYDNEGALEIIRQARQETRDGCGEHRLGFAQTFIDKVGTYENPKILPQTEDKKI